MALPSHAILAMFALIQIRCLWKCCFLFKQLRQDLSFNVHTYCIFLKKKCEQIQYPSLAWSHFFIDLIIDRIVSHVHIDFVYRIKLFCGLILFAWNWIRLRLWRKLHAWYDTNENKPILNIVHGSEVCTTGYAEVLRILGMQY